MNIHAHRSALPELEGRLQALASYARSLPFARVTAQPRASLGVVSEPLRAHQERLEALRVEALLMLEQAGLGARATRSAQASARLESARGAAQERDLDKSADLSTEDLPRAARAAQLERALDRELGLEFEADFAADIGVNLGANPGANLGANPGADLGADIGAAAEGGAGGAISSAEGLIDIDALLSEVETELSRVEEERALEVALAGSAGTYDAIVERTREESPTRRVEPAPAPEPARDALSAEALIERLSTLTPPPQPLSAPSAPPAPQPSAAAGGGRAWGEARELLRALLPPPSRSPDAALPFMPASSARARVSPHAPWLRLDEVDWSGLDWRLVQQQVGAHASLSAGPSAAAPQPRRRLALRLEVQGAEAQGAEAQGAEAQGAEAQGAEGEARWSPSEGPSHDSLDMDAAFAEYDAPLSEEELLADPDLADIARSYATLERRLGEAIAPTMASDEFDPAARDALLSSVDPSAVRDLGLDALVPSSLSSGSPSAPLGEPRLDLPSSPFDSMDEVRFDFGEEDPLVWTEGSPTPLFGDEPSPSPILRNRSARDPLNTPRSVETPVAPEPEGGWHDSSPANEAQRSGVFQRLFGNR